MIGAVRTAGWSHHLAPRAHAARLRRCAPRCDASGLSHALGNQKRFVVRTDRRAYRAGDRAVVTVEAYDKNYEPLTVAKLSQPHLAGELILPGASDVNAATPAGDLRRPLRLSPLREGVFETEFEVPSVKVPAGVLDDAHEGTISLEIDDGRRKGRRPCALYNLPGTI